MVITKQEREYIAPLLEVVDVACEAGFQNSTGELTYDRATHDGWYGTY